jgi:CTP synthase
MSIYGAEFNHDRTKIYEMQHKTVVESQTELDNLTKMRYRDLIDDETFVKERDILKDKIAVIEYARVNKIPYFGLCYGMQLLVIEYARHVAGLTDAHTTEINKNAKHKIIDIMEDQKVLMQKGKYGGSMRLGSYTCALVSKTQAYESYIKGGWGTDRAGSYIVTERHRHRFEVNNAYVEQLEKAGLVFSGTSPDKMLMEIAELPKSKHPFFVGTQFHPEFLARPLDPHPLFTSFIKAASVYKK